MSRDEWDEMHPDYKTTDEDGQRYVLRLEPGTGATVLEPVKVEEPDSTSDRSK